jgi:NADPH:quinone reductase-like Zn-dependent oxidoreductase
LEVIIQVETRKARRPLAKQAGLHVAATAASADPDYVRSLGAERMVDYRKERFEEAVTGVDVVLDTVGETCNSGRCKS